MLTKSRLQQIECGAEPGAHGACCQQSHFHVLGEDITIPAHMYVVQSHAHSAGMCMPVQPFCRHCLHRVAAEKILLFHIISQSLSCVPRTWEMQGKCVGRRRITRRTPAGVALSSPTPAPCLSATPGGCGPHGAIPAAVGAPILTL